MVVDHYQATAINNESFVYRTQSGSNIGTSTWYDQDENIKGLDYEPGYVYDIDVIVEITDTPNGDASPPIYTLKKINTKTKVADGTTFEIFLRRPNFLYLTGNTNVGLKILNKYTIDCGTSCMPLNQALAIYKNTIIGTFTHKTDGSYLLTSLVVK